MRKQPRRIVTRTEARRVFISGLAKSACRVAESEEDVFQREKRKTVEAAVKNFKTRELFMAVMSPLKSLMKDPIAAQFVVGVFEKFKEIDKDHVEGRGWLHEEIK